MKNIEKIPVGQIVAENYKTAEVFTAHNIDFCCAGNRTLERACEKSKVSINQLVDELNQILNNPTEVKHEFENPDQLIDKIISVHHHYIVKTVPTLQMYLEKLCRVHGERHPELYEIKRLFDEGATALLSHLQKEELVLFPFINAMVASKKDGFELSPPHFGDIENPIQMMEHEHSAEGDRFRKIREISNNYKTPTDACQTYKVAYAMLEEFESDLHRHIHLENNVLFLQARQLFKELNY